MTEPASASSPSGAAGLILMNRVPWPLDDGWKVRTFHMVRALARRGPVTVVSFDRGDDPDVEDFVAAAGPRVRLRLVQGSRAYTPWRLLRGLVGFLPVHVLVERSSGFRAVVKEELVTTRPAVIVCELVAMADQLRGWDDLPPLVIDTHNIDSLVIRRYADVLPWSFRKAYALITSWKFARFESRAFRRAAAVLVCSGIEERLLQAGETGHRAWMVPNGADLERFRPVDQPSVPERLLFFGKLDYFPNRDAIEFFLDDILPRIRESFPQVELHIAGAGGDDGLRARLEAEKGVIYHGKVADLNTLLGSAAVVVVPLRSGGGTRLKILEALAAARPLVSTVVGAEGLELEAGRDLLLADDADAFAAAVTGLLRDTQRAAALGNRGRSTVTRRYDWRAIEESLAQRLAALSSSRGLT